MLCDLCCLSSSALLQLAEVCVSSCREVELSGFGLFCWVCSCNDERCRVKRGECKVAWVLVAQALPSKPPQQLKVVELVEFELAKLTSQVFILLIWIAKCRQTLRFLFLVLLDKNLVIHFNSYFSSSSVKKREELNLSS